MSKIVIPAILDDIFNVPRDGTNIKNEEDSQEVAYATALNSNTALSFEDKASNLKGQIAPLSEKTEEIEYITKPLVSVVTKVEPLVVESKIAVTKEELLPIVSEPIRGESRHESSQQSSDYERVLAQAIPVSNQQPKINKQMDAEPAVAPIPIDENEDDEDDSKIRVQLESDDNSPPADPVITNENEEGWLLESSSPKYNQFYAEKRRMIPRLLRGGKIPVDQYSKELIEAQVNTKVEMYDYELIAEKMTEIRQWQTRILEIRGHILSQYHSWKRMVELFHGILAKAEYAKPAICQQGTNYNHMRDMELYLTDLDYLQEFSKDVLANLSNHFESLSRQVTLAMPLKTIERFEQTAVPLPPKVVAPEPLKPVVKKSDLSGFDRLENRPENVVNQKDSGTKKSNSNSTDALPKKNMDWDEIK